MEGIGPTDHVPKGLSTLSQFLLYRQQLLNNPGLGPWIVGDWEALRTNALLSDVEENVVGMKFQAVNFPGPPPASQNWHLWAHATTREGATGILATGKVLPTDYQVADLDATEDTFSFYGRSMNNPEWTPGVVQLACKCFHSTKNCSGIVFAGLKPSNHIKGKSASTSCENNLTRFYPLVHSCSNDRRWAIRSVAPCSDFIFVLSDRSKANFPADPQNNKTQQQKALTGGQSLLALTDQDEAWGNWKPSDSRSNKDAVISDPVTIKQEETEPSRASSARASPS